MTGIEIPTESPHDAYERGRAEVADWIAYANKLEAALKLAAGQRSDILMRMHAEQGLRIVRPQTPLPDHQLDASSPASGHSPQILT